MDVHPPAVAAALHELELLDPRRRPLLAAHWVAQGLGGAALAELAGLRGDEREVSDLWPRALLEVGVSLPVARARRVALPWLAARVTSDDEDLRWLLRQLWPTRSTDTDEDELLDQIVYGIDEALDYMDSMDAGAGGRWDSLRGRRDREVAERLRSNVAASVNALLAGDLVAADAALQH